MERYSVSYANIKNNFVFQNLEGEDSINECYGLFCVLKNILQRGNLTNPSKFLLSELGCLSYEVSDQIRLISNEMPKWYKTIKGNDTKNDYPALFFFEELIPRYLSKFSFIQQLIIPEALIADIIVDKNKQFVDEQVDFYLPQAKLVIEIDGAQHKEVESIVKDRSRDQFFRQKGITVIRIPVESIKRLDNELEVKFKEISKILESCEELEWYKWSLEAGLELNNNLRLQYDAVLRFQLLIVSLLQKGKLEIDASSWCFDLMTEDEVEKCLFKLAFEDIFIWLEHLCRLKKIKYTKPILCFEDRGRNKDELIQINFSMTKRWTDENYFDSDVIFIRNDYFDDKDYFYLATTDSIQYDVRLEEDSLDIESLKFFLLNLFDYEVFNEGQLPIIVNAINRIDTIGILPTGSGKSLCYQIACLLQPCISFVVCPILSLIYDQKQNLDEFRITRTNIITSDKNASEKGEIISEFGQGRYQLIWISPERFQSQAFREALCQINYQKNFAYAVIDEVHCLSEWGHDFRTSYLTLIKTIQKLCPEAMLLGLTATASQFVLEDLKTEFNVDSSHIKSVSSMNRTELNFHLVKVKSGSHLEKYNQLELVLDNIDTKYNGQVFTSCGEKSICGIIFTTNVKKEHGCVYIAENLSKKLSQKVYAYFASSSEKNNIQKAFKANKFTLLTATKAFGMGVNKKNIRYTIHYGLPWSVEAFYQEAGRAGRDCDKTKKSDCYIIYQPESCEQTVIDEIFNEKVTITTIRSLRCELNNDLRNIIDLWLINKNEIEEELNIVTSIMNDLIKKNTNIYQCSEKYKLDKVQQALYRLSILGFIDDWVIDWRDYKRVKVNRCDFTEKKVEENLLRYIRRYDSNFTLSDKIAIYEKYHRIMKDATIKKEYRKYMKVLLVWSYDNIIYHRRKTIQNMMELCDSYTDGETFRAYINNYFRFSDSTIHLDNIINKPDSIENWFELFYKSKLDKQGKSTKILITAKEAADIIPALDRYLESYRYNTGLNYVNVLIRLICNKELNQDGIERLKDSILTIEQNKPLEIDYLVEESLKLLKQSEDESKERYSEILLSNKPEYARKVYNELQDKSSLKFVLKSSLTKLKAVEERLKWLK